MYEVLICILYIATISFIQDQINLRAKLKKKQLNLLFAKIVKDKKDFFSDTEEEEVAKVDVFSKRSDQSILRRKNEGKKSFEAIVRGNERMIKPCFLDCDKFAKSNKRYFIMIVLFQLG